MNNQNRKGGVRAAAVISAGLKRTENQDNFLLNGKRLMLAQARAVTSEIDCYVMEGASDCAMFGVFDGMGGEESGEVASYISADRAADLCCDLCGCSPSADRMLINGFFSSTDEAVSAKAKELGAFCVGSTGVLLWIRNDQVTAANLGDSRCYRIRDGKLRRLSHDHTPTQELIDAGVYTEEEMSRYERSSAVSGFFGMKHIGRSVQPYIHSRFTSDTGDVYILCSDGLTDMLREPELLEVVTACEHDPLTIARGLAQAALHKGGEDNVTVLAVCID